MREEQRAQLRVVGAFLLGALLIALPLFLWRRARGPASVDTEWALDAGSPSDGGVDAAAVVDAAAPPITNVTVGPARVLECHDEGNAKTAPADCDHPPTIEAALSNAILANATCVKNETGTIGYEVDVSFLRKRNPLEITAPHDERTIPNAKTAKACALDVKKTMLSAIDPDGGPPRTVMASAPHAHGRYRLLMTATYTAP